METRKPHPRGWGRDVTHMHARAGAPPIPTILVEQCTASFPTSSPFVTSHSPFLPCPRRARTTTCSRSCWWGMRRWENHPSCYGLQRARTVPTRPPLSVRGERGVAFLDVALPLVGGAPRGPFRSTPSVRTLCPAHQGRGKDDVRRAVCQGHVDGGVGGRIGWDSPF
jgi:hypothetical protein